MKKKRLKIAIATNSLIATQHPAYGNHCQFWFRLGRNLPNIDFIFINPPRMSIDRMRNMAADMVMEVECDYLLFLDDDVLVPPADTLQKLLAMDADVAAGDVLIRGYPFDHMLFNYTNKTKAALVPLKNVPKKLGVYDVDAVGFSLCLIKTSLLLKLPKPLFITGVSNTEDIYFCIKAKEHVPDCTIKVDTSIICSHILWAETIDARNKDNYKKYYERQFPELITNPPVDRGKEYLERIGEAHGETE